MVDVTTPTPPGGTLPARAGLDQRLARGAICAATAGALATLAIVRRWRGSDLPAHVFRVGLVRREGLEVWNNYWYGGHHTLGYGVLFPVLGALSGLWTVAVASAVVSSVLADAVIRAGAPRARWPASIWFAAGTVTNVAIGRLPFALGLTVGLAAVLAAQHHRPVLAGGFAAATSAASPVVSVFLAVVFAAWAFASAGRQRRTSCWLVSAAVVPVLVVAALYPQGGMFPFRWGALLWTLAVCLITWSLVPAAHRLIRAAAVLYAVAALGAFFVPTPLGANVTRLGMYAAGPVLVALVPLRRALLRLALPLVCFWQWSPAFDAMVRANDDPSIERQYHQPLLEFLAGVPGELGRVEVVPTARHWEAAYVAAEMPIARGWERQLDMRFNELFYRPGLTAVEYEYWLRSDGVRFVAVPDVRLDDSGIEEAALIAAGPPFLSPVWSSAHWRVYEVRASTGLVDGPASLVAVGVDTIVLDVTGVGDVTVRVRSSAFWASDPPVCIEPTADGWIMLRDPPVGQVTVYLDESKVVAGGDPCDVQTGR